MYWNIQGLKRSNVQVFCEQMTVNEERFSLDCFLFVEHHLRSYRFIYATEGEKFSL